MQPPIDGPTTRNNYNGKLVQGYELVVIKWVMLKKQVQYSHLRIAVKRTLTECGKYMQWLFLAIMTKRPPISKRALQIVSSKCTMNNNIRFDPNGYVICCRWFDFVPDDGDRHATS